MDKGDPTLPDQVEGLGASPSVSANAFGWSIAT
jgi:hypothetical protein